MTQLYAVPHDGTFDGDSSFYPGLSTSIPYVDGMTLADIKKRWQAHIIEEWCMTANDEVDEVQQMVDKIVGAWIVDVNWLSAVEQAVALTVSRGDSEAYAQDTIIKALTQVEAVRVVGVPAR